MTTKIYAYRQAILLGLGSLSMSVVWPIFNTFGPLLLAEFGFGAAFIGFVMTWDNAINLFLQPLIGHLSDQTTSPWGRRKPWLMLGGPLAAFAFILMPFATSAEILLLTILGLNLGMALFRTPLVSLLGDVFPAEKRSQANGVIHFINNGGQLMALVAAGILVGLVRVLPFIIAAVILLAAILLVLLLVPEPPPSPFKRQTFFPSRLLRGVFDQQYRSLWIVLLMITAWAMGFEALVTWLSSFIYFELGLSAGSTALLLAFGFLLPTIIFALPSGLLAVKFGRLPVILSGFGLMAVVATQGIIVNSPQRLMATLVVAGLASSLVSVNLLPLAYDAGAYAQVGLITGLYYIATNSGGIIGPQVVGQLIAWQGNNYRMVFIFTPIILIGAIVWGIIFKRNYHPQKKSVTT